LGLNSPANSTQQPGALDVAVLHVQVTNSSAIPVTLTGLVLTASGSGNDLTGITGVRVYLDNNADGIVDAGDSPLGAGVYSGDNGTATIILDNILNASSSETLLVVYDLSTTAGSGTYQGNLNAGGFSGTSAYGALQFTGLPKSGAVVTILSATPTPTWTPTVVPSATPTATATHTLTPMPTVTRTHTPIPTFTSTTTATWTASFTDSPTPSVTETFSTTPTVSQTPSFTWTPNSSHLTPISLYPNPSDGGSVQIHIPGRTTVSDIKVQIFTVAFRLVQQQVFPQVPIGTDIQIDLKDKWGHPLASGLYYVLVSIDGKRLIAKLLIER
jgi:hypothetical protein